MEILAKIKTDDIADVVRVQITDSDGCVSQKIVTYDCFLEMLRDSSVSSTDYVGLGAMPNGYVDGSISVKDSNTFRVITKVPADKRPLTYYDSTYVAPFPSLVFEFQVVKGNVTDSHCFALRESDQMLCHYPYGNVHNSGSICWGGNILPQLSRLKDVDILVALFFGSRTNDDLFNSAYVQGSGENEEWTQTQRALIEHMVKQDSFSEKHLVPTGRFLEDLACM